MERQVMGARVIPLVFVASVLSSCGVSSASTGLVVMVDDPGFDGSRGTFLPTMTTIKTWAAGAQRASIEEAESMVVVAEAMAGVAAPGLAFNTADVAITRAGTCFWQDFQAH